jgi:hypothetical protein
MRRFLHFCLERTPVIGVLMAALLFRALIPTGFMPMLGSDGTLVMQLCSGFTTKSVVIHLDASAMHADHAAHAAGNDSAPSHGDLFEHSPCGFAVAAGAPPQAELPFITPRSAHTAPAVPGLVGEPQPTIVRSQGPRGPPFA